MRLHPGAHGSRGDRRVRQLRPSLMRLERRVVLSLTFSDISGITFDTSGDVFVSYDSTTAFSGQQQSVAEVGANGYLVSSSVFSTTGASAFPGVLTTVGGSASLPGIDDPSDILELQPDGELFVFNPDGGTASEYDNLTGYVPDTSNVYDVQTGSFANLGSQIDLTNATYGDFGVDGSSLVVSAESNDWDFVMRVTYASQGAGDRHGPGRITGQRQPHRPRPGELPSTPRGRSWPHFPTCPPAPARRSTSLSDSIFSTTRETLRSRYIPTLGLTTAPRHRQRRDHRRLAGQLHPGRQDLIALRRRARGRAHQLRPDRLPRRSDHSHPGDSFRNHLPGRGRNELSRVD